MGFTKEDYPKAVQIVDVPGLFDGGFQESTFSAQAAISEMLGIDLFHPVFVNLSNAIPQLQSAFKRGYRIFLFPSFALGTVASEFYRNNKAELEAEKNLLFLGIDNLFQEGLFRKGTAVTANFRTDEASFVAGYAAAAYLANKYDDPEERVVYTFGGVMYRGVTDFVFGFIEGVKVWNQKNKRKVKFAANTVDLTSGFDPSSPAAGISIGRSLANKKTKIIFPVAISLVSRLLGTIEKNKDVHLIGVDSDGAKIFTQHSHRFFTSVLKRIGRVVYDVLEDFYTGTTKVLTKEFLDSKANLDLKKGLLEDWVGVAPSTFTDANIANPLLKTGRTVFFEQLKDPKSTFSVDRQRYLEVQEGQPIADFLSELVTEINKQTK